MKCNIINNDNNNNFVLFAVDTEYWGIPGIDVIYQQYWKHKRAHKPVLSKCESLGSKKMKKKYEKIGANCKVN